MPQSFRTSAPKPHPIRFALAATSTHSIYSLSGAPGISHRSAQPSTFGEADGLIVAAINALSSLTDRRQEQQLTELREWTALSSPAYAKNSIPNPLLLPLKICTDDQELIEAATFLRLAPLIDTPANSIPSLAALLQIQLKRFDTTWFRLPSDSEELAALKRFAVLCCVPTRSIIEGNDERLREFHKAASREALHQLEADCA